MTQKPAENFIGETVDSRPAIVARPVQVDEQNANAESSEITEVIPQIVGQKAADYAARVEKFRAMTSEKRAPIERMARDYLKLKSNVYELDFTAMMDVGEPVLLLGEGSEADNAKLSHALDVLNIPYHLNSSPHMPQLTKLSLRGEAAITQLAATGAFVPGFFPATPPIKQIRGFVQRANEDPSWERDR